MALYQQLVDAIVVIGAEDILKLKPLPPYNDTDSIAYEPSLLDCIPTEKKTNSIIRDIAMFCLPDGLSLSRHHGQPKGSKLILTDELGSRWYGTCLTFFDILLSPDSEENYVEFEKKFMKSVDKNIPNLSELLESPKVRRNSQKAVNNAQNEEVLYCSKCICILSKQPFFELFHEYLTQIYAYVFRDQILRENEGNPLNQSKLTRKVDIPVERFLSNFVSEIPVVPPGADIILQISAPFETLHLSFQTLNDFPTLQLSLKTLFTCLDKNNVLLLFTAVLLERKILFTSATNNLLTTIAELIYSLTYPFYWGYVYIPLLPPSLSECTEAPTPYIMGINKQYFHKIDKQLPIIIVDLDNNTITNRGDPLPPLPPKEKEILLEQLLPCINPDVFEIGKVYPFGKRKYSAEEIEKMHLLNERKIRLAFLTFSVGLIADFKIFIKINQMNEKIFDNESFLDSQPESSKEFLDQFLDTNAFISFFDRYKSNCPALGIFNKMLKLYHKRQCELIELSKEFENVNNNIYNNNQYTDYDQPEALLRISINDPTLISSTETIPHRKNNCKIPCFPRFEEELFIQSPNLRTILDQIDIYLLRNRSSIQLHLFKASLLAHQGEFDSVISEFSTALTMDSESVNRDQLENLLNPASMDQLLELSQNSKIEIIRVIAKEIFDTKVAEKEKEKQREKDREKAKLTSSAGMSMIDNNANRSFDLQNVLDSLKNFQYPQESIKRHTFLNFLYNLNILDDENTAIKLLDILCRDTRGVSIPVKTLEEFMNTLYKMYSEVKSLTIANKAVLIPREIPLYSHPTSSFSGRKEKFLLTANRLIFFQKKGKSRVIPISDIDKVETLNYQIVLPPGVPLRDTFYYYLLELIAANRMSSELRDKRIIDYAIQNIILSESIDKKEKRKVPQGCFNYFGAFYPNSSWFFISTKLSSIGMLNITEDHICEEEVHNELGLVSTLLSDIGKLFFEHVKNDGCNVDFDELKKTVKWETFFQLTSNLQRVDISKLNSNEKTFFFINLYNIMVIHAYIVCGTFPTSMWEWRYFERLSYYTVGGVAYSIGDIHHGLLRKNEKAPWDEEPYFFPHDPRKDHMDTIKSDPRILFLLANHTEISPWIFKLSVENLESTIKVATEYYCQENVTIDGNIITLSKLFFWFQSDFGGSVRAVLSWITNYLSAAKKKKIQTLLETNTYEVKWICQWTPSPKPLRGEI